MKKLRIGILLDDLKVSYYVNELINFIEREESFDKVQLLQVIKIKNLKVYIKKY